MQLVAKCLLLLAIGSQSISNRILCGQEPPGHNSIQLHITDLDGNPISEAQASVMLWDGKWSETQWNATTDKLGQAKLEGLPPNKYFGVVIKAHGYAPTCSASEMGKQENRSLTLKLSRPVSSTITVRSDDGKPVQGAMLSLLVVNDDGGGAMATRYGSTTPYGTTLPESDAEGNIVLNDLPKGAKISMTVLHPDWVQAKVQDLIASEGHIGSAYLKSGDTIQVNLVRDETVATFPITELFNLNVMPKGSDSKNIPYVFHLFNARDDKFHATLEQLEYDSINLQAKNEDIIVTPFIERMDTRFQDILSRPVDGKRSIDFLVRKARSFQCKLVGDLSLLNEESFAQGSTENRGPYVASISGSLHEFIGCSFVEPSADGKFTIKLPNGIARIEVRVPGAKVTPLRFDLVVEPDMEPVIPEFRLEKEEKIRGSIVDAEGKPIRNAVVRFYHGVWGTDYQRSDDQGEFQLDTNGALRSSENTADSSACSVIAFEPNGKRAGNIEIDSKSFDIRSPLTVIMEERSPSWIVDQIQQNLENRQSKEMRDVRQHWTEEVKTQRKTFAAGDLDQVPPDLSEGEWLQSECRSLGELHGKLVLLDFWFIGCGPCAADAPALKLVHELFAGPDFEIVGVHASAGSAENVLQYVQKNGVVYPTVVDTKDEKITRSYRELGVTSFPSYILLDRDGKIMHNDHLSMKPSLRAFKVEVIHSALRSAREAP